MLGEVEPAFPAFPALAAAPNEKLLVILDELAVGEQVETHLVEQLPIDCLLQQLIEQSLYVFTPHQRIGREDIVKQVLLAAWKWALVLFRQLSQQRLVVALLKVEHQRVLFAKVQEKIGVLQIVYLVHLEYLVLLQRLKTLVGRNALVEGKAVSVDERKRHQLTARNCVQIGRSGLRSWVCFSQVLVGWIFGQFFLFGHDDLVVCVVGAVVEP